MKEERARTKQKRTQEDILKQWQRFGTILQDMLNINKKAYTQNTKTCRVRLYYRYD